MFQIFCRMMMYNCIILLLLPALLHCEYLSILPGVSFLNSSDYDDYYYDTAEPLPSDPFIPGEGEHPLTFKHEKIPSNYGDNATTYSNVIEVPHDVFRNLSQAADLESVAAMLGITENTEEEAELFSPDWTHVISRSGGQGRLLLNPEQAHCEPELRTVDLGLDENIAGAYYPSCVRIMQCGGCCHNKELFSCQPIASQKVLVKVLELKSVKLKSNALASPMTEGEGERIHRRRRPKPRGRGRERRRNKKVNYKVLKISVEEHTKCECMCKLKEADCDLSVHTYSHNTCSCNCQNSDEEYKCYKTNSHYWNRSTCQCLCRDVQDCSTGERFDQTTCGCVSESNFFRYEGKQSKQVGSQNSVEPRDSSNSENMLRDRPYFVSLMAFIISFAEHNRFLNQGGFVNRFRFP